MISRVLMRIGCLVAVIGAALALGVILNPLAASPAPNVYSTGLGPKGVTYQEIYLMGSDHLLRILIPEGFRAVFGVTTLNGRTIFVRNLSEPVVTVIHPPRRGWYIFYMMNLNDDFGEFTFELRRTRDVDVSAVIDALLLVVVGVLILALGIALKVRKRKNIRR